MLSIKRKNILSWYSLVDELPDLCFVVLPFGTKCKGWNSQATCAPVRRQASSSLAAAQRRGLCTHTVSFKLNGLWLLQSLKETFLSAK
ncbi:jg1645 [Pararge aegeria aegeria]|uniref:Jg1645 protein n=1 Tax=Pararge aegeria aegeria TaxID=348720 RepID=A0A8S4RCH5_9NEOP|nr:jg1645 [Pararge aegeria aegeria]